MRESKSARSRETPDHFSHTIRTAEQTTSQFNISKIASFKIYPAISANMIMTAPLPQNGNFPLMTSAETSRKRPLSEAGNDVIVKREKSEMTSSSNNSSVDGGEKINLIFYLVFNFFCTCF